MTEQPWSCTVTCKPAGIDIPQTRQDTGRTSHSVLFPENSVNHPVNCDSHRPSVAHIFLPSGSRFLIAFSSVKLAPGYTNSCSLILPG